MDFNPIIDRHNTSGRFSYKPWRRGEREYCKVAPEGDHNE